jgi:hypothetical protein
MTQIFNKITEKEKRRKLKKNQVLLKKLFGLTLEENKF